MRRATASFCKARFARSRTASNFETIASRAASYSTIGYGYVSPIVNYPETAILGVGEIKEKPRVVGGDVVPRKVLTLDRKSVV